MSDQKSANLERSKKAWREGWKMGEILTRAQFDVLVAMAGNNGAMTQRGAEKATGYSLGTINRVMKELTEKKYIAAGMLSEAGFQALEPYRVKRAVFIAAGFGSRMVPITLNTPKPLVRVNGVRIIDRLIDACLRADINEIYVVRGYLAEQFDQLLYKYPMIRFLENPAYNESNNISSAYVARYMLSNAYVFESDLVLSSPDIIKKYHYASNFLGVRKERTDDWCFTVKDGIIDEEKIGGTDCWQMMGISYWDEKDGHRLSQDIAAVYASPGGKERYWEQVPLVYAKEHYAVEPRECFESDIVEIDTFRELKEIDRTYDV